MKRIFQQSTMYLALLMMILMFTSCGRSLPDGDYKGENGDAWTVKGKIITFYHPGIPSATTGLEYMEFTYKIKGDEFTFTFDNGQSVTYSYKRINKDTHIIEGTKFTRQQ